MSPATLARVFFRLGVLGFGGPAAHIALMHEDIVHRRQWLSNEQFADLIAATNLIPGPNSTEMAIHIGRRLGGWPGFAIAGACFILPAAIIVGTLAAVYVAYGDTPDLRAVMNGIFPVMIAIIAQATIHLARTALGSPVLVILAAGCALFALHGVNELVLLASGGVLAAIARAPRRAPLVGMFLLSGSTLVAAAVDAAPVTLHNLAVFFLKVGAVLYGSGYVLVAFLRADLVERWGWLTDQQLLDAVAVGQVTPGPLFTTATFIGAVLGGWPGAVVATVAIFLPAFVFVALTQPWIPRIRESRLAGAFLDGVVAASLGLMAAVVVRLAHVALTTPVAWTMAVLAFVVLIRWRVNSAWLIAAGAAAGFAQSLKGF